MKTVEELIHLLNQMPVGARPVILDGDGVVWSIKTMCPVPDAASFGQVVLEVDEELD